MADDEEQITEALAILDPIASAGCDPPPVVIVPDEGGGLIRGNRAGLIRLAFAALKASRGDDQKFEETWLVQDGLAGIVNGISLDRYAHYDLPKEHSRWERIKSSIILFAVLGMVGAIFVTGLVTLTSWLGSLLGHLH